MATIVSSEAVRIGGDVELPGMVRVLDAVGSLLGLLMLSPLFLVIALAVKLTSPGPIFYRGERVGEGGRLFRIYKFRSMVAGAEKKGPGVTCHGDPRVTRVGRVLRHAKLDELPQLINVLRGEMSLVGPRPEDPRYVKLYTDEQRHILAYRPGITGAASLRYRDEERLLSGDDWQTVYRERVMPEKLALDLDYLRHRTAWSDLFLVLRTFASLLLPAEASAPGEKLQLHPS